MNENQNGIVSASQLGLMQILSNICMLLFNLNIVNKFGVPTVPEVMHNYLSSHFYNLAHTSQSQGSHLTWFSQHCMLHLLLSGGSMDGHSINNDEFNPNFL